LEDKTLFTQFVRVNGGFVEALLDLIDDDTFDDRLITFWPRRANGSMDYPSPLDMSDYKPTHRTFDSLRIRDTANTDST
jgi:hypothetical protein